MNETTIRGWFSQFGKITQIIVDTSWQKAILVYSDYESACKAWNDPRPVFDNRFVKIWWRKTEAMDQSLSRSNSNPNAQLSGTIVDEVELEIARESAKKAQKEHEEKQRRKEELEKKKEELERQRVQLEERQRIEREKLMEKIRRAEERAKAKAAGQQSQKPQEPPKEQQQSGQQQSGLSTISTPLPPTESSDKATNGDTNGDTPAQDTPDEATRKAHLQKMLAD